MRIRHYGFLANACRKRTLALISAHAPQTDKPLKPKRAKETQLPHWPCQKCKTGTLRFIGIVTVDEVMNKGERTSWWSHFLLKIRWLTCLSAQVR